MLHFLQLVSNRFSILLVLLSIGKLPSEQNRFEFECLADRLTDNTERSVVVFEANEEIEQDNEVFLFDEIEDGEIENSLDSFLELLSGR
jgi:hypothetical protein